MMVSVGMFFLSNGLSQNALPKNLPCPNGELNALGPHTGPLLITIHPEN